MIFACDFRSHVGPWNVTLALWTCSPHQRSPDSLFTVHLAGADAVSQKAKLVLDAPRRSSQTLPDAPSFFLCHFFRVSAPHRTTGGTFQASFFSSCFCRVGAPHGFDFASLFPCLRFFSVSALPWVGRFKLVLFSSDFSASARAMGWTLQASVFSSCFPASLSNHGREIRQYH